MTPHRPEHLELCAGLAIGALDEADRAALEAHLASGCPECEAELRRLATSVSLLAAAAPPLAPPAALRARVLAAARAEARAGSAPARAARVLPLAPQRRRSYAAWVWAVAAAGLAVSGWFAWNTADRLQRELASSRDALARAERALAEERRWSALLDSPQARTVSLTPTPQGTAIMRARAIYDPATRRAVIVFENVSAPAGSDYQLWALQGAGVSSLGLIRADAAGRAIIRLENAGDPATLGGFAVSLEQAGGSPKPDAPTGPVVMAGKFGG